MKKRIILLKVLVYFMLIPCLSFSEMSSGNYRISISDQNAGGGVMASANYKAVNAIGQYLTGVSQTGNTVLSGGLFPVIVPPLIGPPKLSLPERLGKVVVYPNPARLGLGHTKITFGHPTNPAEMLTEQTTIRIYTIAGELVKTIEKTGANGQVPWDITNKSGKRLASGVYIYFITNPRDEKCIGKLAIIK